MSTVNIHDRKLALAVAEPSDERPVFSQELDPQTGPGAVDHGFRVLGTVEARVAGESIELGPKQRQLLAVLLLHANRAVSSDAISDALWGSRRTSADNRLPVAIGRLRRALAPLEEQCGPLLRTIPGGYMLITATSDLDAETFQARVTEGLQALAVGDPGRAAALLESALALWRGTPLLEVSFEEFAVAEVRRLEELRLVALEALIDAQLELGNHANLIGELTALAIEQPTREHLTAQLILALYRCGRQADALAAYERIRVQLATTLGLRPGPALKHLQTQILRHDRALGRTTTRPRRPVATAHRVVFTQVNLRPPTGGQPAIAWGASNPPAWASQTVRARVTHTSCDRLRGGREPQTRW